MASLENQLCANLIVISHLVWYSQLDALFFYSLLHYFFSSLPAFLSSPIPCRLPCDFVFSIVLYPFFYSTAVLSSIIFVFSISMVFHFIVQLFRTIRSKHFLFEEAFFNCCTGRSYSLLLSQRRFFLAFPFVFLSFHRFISAPRSLFWKSGNVFPLQRVFYSFSDWNHVKSISFCWTFIHLPPGTLSLLNLPRLWK